LLLAISVVSVFYAKGMNW